MTAVARRAQRAQGKLGRCRPAGISLHLPDDLTLDEWLEIGRQLARGANGFAWWIADWAWHGRRRAEWGTTYAEMIDATGLDYDTVQRYAYVAGRVEGRRREQLSFAHHAEVAPLIPAEQVEWLDRAESEGWTRSELRDALRQARALSNSETGRVVVTVVRISVPPEREERWREAAGWEGLDLADWLAELAEERVARLLSELRDEIAAQRDEAA